MSAFVRSQALSRFALLVVIAWAIREAPAQERAGAVSPTEGRQRVLVLQDGGVLTGQIEQKAERYVVTRAGVQMEMAASRVLYVCDTLEEAYQHRRQQLGRPTAESHLALAEWCLRYNLLEAARRELAEARGLDERHPRLPLLERRLAYASQPPSAPPVAKQATQSPASPAEAENSQAEGAVAAELSPRIIERFTRKVQPVLVNNCTTAGCHQPGGAESFQLDRALLHGLANRRSTMSNLTATLALVDRKEPQHSPLLTVPREAHGGLDEAVFGPRDRQAFQHVVEWVALVVQNEPSGRLGRTKGDALPLSKGEGSATASNASMASDRRFTGDEEPPLPSSEYESAIDAVDQASYDEAVAGPGPLPPSPRLRFGAQLERWQPRDPFDPEIFNRRMAARRRATTAVVPNAQPAGP